MVPSRGPLLDDVFVIWMFGRRRPRCAQFVPWSAPTGPPEPPPATPRITDTKDHIMNTQTLLATVTFALAALSAGAASAQEATPDVAASTGALSRASVLADATRSVHAGDQHEARQIELNSAPSKLRSRDAVRAETVAALRSGEITRLNAETWGFDRQLPPAVAATRVAQATR
jgi:hypothetical protein